MKPMLGGQWKSPAPSSARIRQRHNLAAVIDGTSHRTLSSLKALATSFSVSSYSPLSSTSPIDCSPELSLSPSPSSSFNYRVLNHVRSSSSRFVHACRRAEGFHIFPDSCLSDGIYSSIHLNDYNMGYAGGDHASIMPLIASRVSLPSRVGSVDLTAILPPELRQRYADPNHILRDPSILSSADTAPIRGGKVHGSHAEYVALVQRLLALGMVAPVLRPVIINGLFCVPKEGESLRLIIDARGANDLFVEPPKVELPTPDLLTRLVADPSRPLYTAKADIDNYYHRLRLPCWMRRLFALPPVKASEVGLSGPCLVDGQSIVFSPDDLIYPACVTMPMGWSHSVFAAQRAHEYVIDSHTSLRREDRIDSAHDLLINRVRHAIYIDDMSFFGHDLSDISHALDEYVHVVDSIDLLVKRSKLIRPTIEPVECIGLEIDGRRHTIGVSPHKLHALQHDTSRLVARQYVSGLELSALIGKWTWGALIARPALSTFSAVYRFIECARHRVFRLWPTVIRELDVISGLAPLLYSSLTAPVAPRVVASDASERGCGVCARRLVDSDVDFISSPPIDGSVGGSKSFPDINASQLLMNADDWSVIVSSRWSRTEHINILEARALISCMRWVASLRSSIKCRVLVLSDSQVIVGSASKGRSSSPQLLRRLRSLASICLSAGLQPRYYWIPSQYNPADEPSRRFD